MTARDFCNLYNYNGELYIKFAWARGCAELFLLNLTDSVEVSEVDFYLKNSV